MDSPLTQVLRPETFEPKIIQLYLYLFNVLVNEEGDDAVPLEGFWRELFLLKPDKQKLYDILEPMTATEFLHMQTQTRLFFKRAIAEAGSGVAPQNEHALENLTAFLCAVFTKRYANPNTDVIEVLSGLDGIDTMMSDLVRGLESIIRQATQVSFRHKALETVLALVAGGFHTSLVSYFMHRDLFSALMKSVHDLHGNPGSALKAIVLVGALSSYHKFESQNVYQNRLEDFVNEDTIRVLVDNFADACVLVRDQYVAVQEDYPTPWSFNSTLAIVGLRGLSPNGRNPPPLSDEEAKAAFSSLPLEQASCLLSFYSFIQANKLFAANILHPPPTHDKEPAFAAFLSSTSYIGHHAYRGSRQSAYAVLSLLSIRILVEDKVLGRRICSTDSKIAVRLCRQRAPYLPLVTAPRVPAVAILDICTDVLGHNLRKRLDVPLYSLALGLILRVVTTLEQIKLRLHHHWAYLWGSLLSLLRFLTHYAGDLKDLRGIREDVCPVLTNLAAFCLCKGDGFLPDPASFDDLFYKLIEAHDVLLKFRDVYCVGGPPSEGLTRAVAALVSVTSHYHDLLTAKHGRKPHQSPVAIQKVIKEGYETLNLEADEGFGRWERWRESNWKAELKRAIRIAVEDARVLSLR